MSGVNRRGSQQGEISVSLSGNAFWKVWHVKMEDGKAGVEESRVEKPPDRWTELAVYRWEMVTPLGRHLTNLF